jgi:hypothetical protein
MYTPYRLAIGTVTPICVPTNIVSDEAVPDTCIPIVEGRSPKETVTTYIADTTRKTEAGSGEYNVITVNF